MPGRDEVLTHAVTMYAKQVTAGRLKKNCGPYEIKACQRHLDDLERVGDPDFPYVFDTTRADRILRWYGLCIQIRGPEAGRPLPDGLALPPRRRVEVVTPCRIG